MSGAWGQGPSKSLKGIYILIRRCLIPGVGMEKKPETTIVTRVLGLELKVREA